MRNVPDVALNADPNSGYSIYYRGAWTVYGGTSCAAPLWAAFTARVNQQRLANGSTLLGFANPAIYTIAKGARYGTDLFDVTQGTNLYYAAVTGFDNATGWGSFNGANLLADLAPVTSYTLTYSSGVNGSISGITSQTVSSGGSGTPVTAVAGSGYHFVSWSDGVATATRTDTNVAANINVTASFDSDPYSQIVGHAQVYYGLLQLAYDNAATGAVIKAQGIPFPENLTMDKPVSVTLSGGWDPTFTTRNDYTILQGVLTISQGKLVADHLIIK
jgi:subtilase family serine protease